ncbi:TolC family outer membrane protein [Halomonas sp. GFAJ-1]|uniref:TolC family outer membrane protein n=1 Tax=Halomonas sp. GFAJ-1 TaxID=1118153 RepID=UPI00023A5E08|nr:TolC family outer membrane protein [Halomonas sp. GFAJ-1]AVI62944.1 channel protein TolC [Halomonas sp. GFAJ-1]EHK61840.1 TolC family type I secretion outer membrane protein [Halomonas sp. GFAJ-1]
MFISRYMHSMTSTITVLIVVMASGATANQAHGGLLDVYQLARDNDPIFREQFYGKQAADELYYQARSALLPQVSVTASQSQTYQNIRQSDNESFDSGSVSFPTTRYGASISQSVYDYARWSSFAQSKKEIRQAASELEVVRQNLLYRVAERYFDALSIYENLSYLQAEKGSVEANYQEVLARFEDGLTRSENMLDARARLEQVRAREIEVQNALRDAIEALAEMIGAPPQQLVLLGSDLQLSRPDPDSQEAWETLAIERSPRLKAAELATEVANRSIDVRRGGHFPTLDLQLNYDFDDTDGSLFGGGSEVETQEIALRLNVPVYSGGRTSSEVRESVSLLEASRSQLEGVTRELRREVRSSYQSILSAKARERSLRRSLEASEQVVESRQVSVETGIVPLRDLLDAERDLFFARSELAAARYDYLINVLRLKRATGVINVDDLREIDERMNEHVSISNIFN